MAANLETMYHQLQAENGRLESEVRLYRMFYGPLDRINPVFLANFGMSQPVLPSAPVSTPAYGV